MVPRPLFTPSSKIHSALHSFMSSLFLGDPKLDLSLWTNNTQSELAFISLSYDLNLSSCHANIPIL